MRILDSRRLTGASLWLDAPGAILDVELQALDPDAAAAAWRRELAVLLDAVGWSGAAVAVRAHAGGLSLAFEAPIDALYAATEVNEAAWHAAAAELGGGELPREGSHVALGDEREDAEADGDSPPSLERVVERLRAEIATERNPALIALAAEAARRGLTLLTDDRRASIGLGSGSRSWPIEESASIDGRLPWSELSDVPVALVTGTNGKTTTVRWITAMVRAAGLTPGSTTTDAVIVGDEVLAEGDYSGPNGARTVLRDRRVQIGVLETARGGLLRRGLAVPHARVALVTNVSADHLGEFGIADVRALGDAKLVVAKAVLPDGALVLNADDPLLLERGLAMYEADVVWFTLDASHEEVRAHLARGGEACVLDGEALVWASGDEREELARIAEVPALFGGAARHNLANALGAIAVAKALGLDAKAIRAGLLSFDATPALNPGRANRWDLGGVTVLLDYAHNVAGLDAIAPLCASITARRRAVVMGQAGDRDDAAIGAFAQAAWKLGPDAVFVKEMETMLRGREPGVIPALIEAELRAAGAASVARYGSELDAVRAALAWAREGDFVLLTVHVQREAVFALLERLMKQGWRAGEAVE